MAVHTRVVYTAWGLLPGGQGGAAAPPDFGETYFNTFRPPDFGGFCIQYGILFEKKIKK